MDPVEVKDLLLSRYHNIEYVNSLPFPEGAAIVKKAYEERDKEFWHKHYIAIMPHMSEFKTFDKWYGELYEEANRTNYYAAIPSEDILEQVAAIRAAKAKAEEGEKDGI